jgi:putative endopeptidase
MTDQTFETGGKIKHEPSERARTWLGHGLAALCLASVACSNADEAAAAVGIDETFLDPQTDPCTDFYQFACGSWISEHPVDQYPTRRFEEGDGRNSILLRRILESDAMGTPYIADRDASLLGKYYSACKTSRTSASVSHVAVDALLAAVASAVSRDDLADVIATLHAAGVRAFFWLGVQGDPGDPSRPVATLMPDGWNLDRSYFMTDATSVLSQYQVHISNTARLYGTEVNADQAIMVESALGKNARSHAAERDPYASYNLTPISSLRSTGAGFPWDRYLASAQFHAFEQLNVSDPDYLAKLEELWAAAPLDTLKTYLKWQVIEAYASALGRDFVVEEARFHRGVFFGDPTPADDSWACLQSAQSAYGFSLSRPFVSVVLDADKKASVEHMREAIRTAFHSDMASRDWLDPIARADAESKLDKISAKVGSPEIWPSAFAPGVTSYLDWSIEAARERRRTNIDSLTRGLDNTAWAFAPSVANAAYLSQQNEIVLPAAILQHPQFAVARADAVNYGALGTIIGHELTHGFDDSGRQFDGDGKLRMRWSPAVVEEYAKRAECVAEQYAQYEPVPGQHIDGQATLGENIADLGGVRLAYLAYHAAGQRESFGGRFDPEQQFFLSYAQQWCSHLRDEVVASSLRSDPHSPDKFRVNGVVRNVPEFANAFHCAVDSPMAPTTRCSVW